MKPKFKIGPAKTRDGREARIYALDGVNGEIHAAALSLDCGWQVFAYCPDGRLSQYSESDPEDLLPNVEPEVFEFECSWVPYGSEGAAPDWTPPEKYLIGKRTKVRIEVLE